MSDELTVIPSLIVCATLCIWCALPQKAVSLSLSNNPMASTPAAAVPFVITFGYNNFTQGPNKRIAKFNVCGVKIKDAG